MIVSNLKLTASVFGFFILACSKLESDKNFKNIFTLVVIILVIIFLMAYPVSTMLFLIKN